MKFTVRDLRINAGLSQKQLADAVGCSTPTIQLWETKAYRPSPHFIERLSWYFRVKKEDLDIAPPRKRGPVPKKQKQQFTMVVTD